MCKLYSDVINNAELASRKIATTDPAKRQWYKKVLEYQIKEKKFREKLQKQQAKKLEQKLEAAEYARAQAQAAMVAQAEAQQAAALEEVKRQNALIANNQPKATPASVTPNTGFGLNPSSN
jgi:septal ring factor EnvC (AmiA/AmiB activator)